MRLMPDKERPEVVGSVHRVFVGADVELTPEQAAELDRRAEDALRHPGRGISEAEAFLEIRKRLLTRK